MVRSIEETRKANRYHSAMYRARNLDEIRLKARERMRIKRGTTKIRIQDNEDLDDKPGTKSDQRKKPHPKFRHKTDAPEDSSKQSSLVDTTPSDATNPLAPQTPLPSDSAHTSQRAAADNLPVVINVHTLANGNPSAIEGQVTHLTSWPASSGEDTGYILLKYQKPAAHDMSNNDVEDSD